MKQLTCEMCGGTDLMKQDGVFVCQSCGCKYSVEEAKKMMIEGTVDVSGSTVRLDNAAIVDGYIENARRARKKEDWAEVEKYYNLVEQYAPKNIEAIFYSSYGKLRETIMEIYSPKWDNAFHVLEKSISVLDDYYEIELEVEQKAAIFNIVNDIKILLFPKENNVQAGIQNPQSIVGPHYRGVENGAKKLVLETIRTLNNIIRKYQEAGKECDDLEQLVRTLQSVDTTPKACYVATAVYGSYDCPQVWTLRRFRDFTLAETWYGRAFIRTYYAISPTLVKWFGHTEWFKNMWKGKLDRMVANLNASGVADTPYEDKVW